MGQFSAETFTTTLALIGVVILVSALLSGFIERSGLPQVAIFLALGATLGPAGLGVLSITLDSPVLRVVATLSLALVLFTDAVTIDLLEVRRRGPLTLLLVGPGTLLSAALIGFAGWWLLKLSVPAAAILGAALASTDPVLLRGLLRRRDVPDSARQALRLESGLNDLVLLPIVLVAMNFLDRPSGLDAAGWGKLFMDLFLLGPGAGVLVALLAISTLELVRRKIGIRRDYESLYSLGVAFTAYALAESVHGSGFLAAFAAGLTISALDVELCDCFLEYGETTAEMALLLTFVLFGSSLIWNGFTVLSGASIVFALLVVAIRPPVFLLTLARAKLDLPGRLLIAWFGPRGLSSLLQILLPVFAGLPTGRHLFALCCLPVLVSVVLHGGTPIVLTRANRRTGSAAVPSATVNGDTARKGPPPTPPSTLPLITLARRPVVPRDTPPLSASVPETSDVQPDVQHHVVPTPEPVPASEEDEEDAASPVRVPDRISLAEVRQLQASRTPPILLDVRTDRTYNRSALQAAGALRLPPDHVVDRAAEFGLPHEAWLVAFCA